MAFRDLYLLTSETNSMRMENDGDGNPIYVGKAAPGSSEGSEVWQIRKITYVSTNPTAVNFPNGCPAYNFSWTLRTGYTYS